MRSALSSFWTVRLVCCALLVGAAPRSAGAYDLATCGPVPDGQIGVLTADVLCTPEEAIQLGRGSTLQMNGHSVSAETPTAGVGVLCERGKCAVEGPGEIFGFRDIGIVALSSSRLDVRNVVLHDNKLGVLGDRVRLTDVELSNGGGCGVIANRLDAVRVTGSGNAEDGMTANACRLTDVVTSGNARSGVTCRRVKAVRFTATGNGRFGVYATRPGAVKLTDSTLTGNAIADLATEHVPRLKGSTCDASRRLDQNGGDVGTWGVCTAD